MGGGGLEPGHLWTRICLDWFAFWFGLDLDWFAFLGSGLVCLHLVLYLSLIHSFMCYI